MKATELSNKNAAAATKGIILGDDPHQTVAEAKDSKTPAYVGSGKYNHNNGTVNLEAVLGRFDKR